MNELVAQITAPGPNDNPYAWFLVIALGALGFIGLRYLSMLDKRYTDCEAERKTCRELADRKASEMEADLKQLRDQRRG